MRVINRKLKVKKLTENIIRKRTCEQRRERHEHSPKKKCPRFYGQYCP